MDTILIKKVINIFKMAQFEAVEIIEDYILKNKLNELLLITGLLNQSEV